MEKQRIVSDPEVTEGNNSERDIFADPTIAQGQGRDPIAELIKAQWKPLLVTVLLAFAVVYIRNSWNESYQRGMESSADAFYKAQDAFEKLKESQKKVKELEAKPVASDAAQKEKDQKERDEAKADLKTREERMQQTLAILRDSNKPYNKFADILGALEAKEKGDMQGVKKALASYSIGSLRTLKGADKFVAEISLVTLGRVLLDGAETETEGKNILKALAKDGETVAVSAALTLSRIATTDEEKKESATIIADLSARYPEQAATLKQ